MQCPFPGCSKPLGSDIHYKDLGHNRHHYQHLGFAYPCNLQESQRLELWDLNVESFVGNEFYYSYRSYMEQDGLMHELTQGSRGLGPKDYHA